MSDSWRIDEARVSVLLDIRHPLACLALHPTLEFAQDVGIEINWLPFAVQPLNPPSRPGPEDDRGIRLTELLTEAFRAYWALELDPASQPAVEALLEKIGVGAAAYREWWAGEGAAAAASLAEALRERGLSTVPCYLVNGEVFLGRQHLPMIRWILEGRSGPGPI
jgi:hypothetical protein